MCVCVFLLFYGLRGLEEEKNSNWKYIFLLSTPTIRLLEHDGQRSNFIKLFSIFFFACLLSIAYYISIIHQYATCIWFLIKKISYRYISEVLGQVLVVHLFITKSICRKDFVERAYLIGLFIQIFRNVYMHPFNGFHWYNAIQLLAFENSIHWIE